MNLKTKEVTLKTNTKFKLELERQKLFFDKPEALKLLKSAGLAFFAVAIPILEAELLIFLDNQLSKSLKSNKISKAILDYTSTEINNEELLSSCGIQQKDSTSIDDVTVDSKKIYDKISARNLQTVEVIIATSLLLLFIYKEMKKLFKRNEHISKHRAKYLQKLIRNTYQVLKVQYTRDNSKIDSMLKALKNLDEILVAIGIATALYFVNRELLQKQSKQTLDDTSGDTSCAVSPEPSDPSINSNPLPSEVNCPAIIDDELVPHVPLEVRSPITCEVPTEDLPLNESTGAPDLATYAIIRNKKNVSLIPFVTIGSQLDQSTVLGSLNNEAVYSPVVGFVHQIDGSDFILRDISDPIDYLSTQINLLGSKYEQLNNLKSFLKIYYVPSLYPGMLAISNIDDKINTSIGVDIHFKKIDKEAISLSQDYDKKIKDITGKDNVEKHAKNETLIEIKNQINTEDKSYYDNLIRLGNESIMLAKRTTARLGEYDLLKYYTELVAGLNTIKTPTTLESEFRTMINSYVKRASKNSNRKDVIKEGNTINKYMANLWKEFQLLPTDINQINTNIDSLSTFKSYSITEWDGYPARLYTICDEPTCKSSETNDYVNPKSTYGLGDIEYWLKYCAGATLASVINPASGWSTGWIFPTPILFPVVYVPVKSIETKYGFIVIGLTICGIWIFPFTLFANLSTNHNIPIGDPIGAIKREIEALKKTITENLRSLKKVGVKKMLEDTKIQVNAKKTEIENIRVNIKNQKAAKPKKKNKQYLSWVETNASLQEQLLQAKIENLASVRKYKLLQSVYKDNTPIKGVESLDKSAILINAQLAQLDVLTDNADKIIAALPVAMKPDSANFGITLKNTKPIISIAKDLDDNVNEEPLNKITQKFNLNNADMMSSNYDTKLKSSVINYKSYTKKLSLSSLATVKKDPFPKYELLKPTNVQWLSFLYKDFVTTGAKVYGYPNFPPF